MEEKKSASIKPCSLPCKKAQSHSIGHSHGKQGGGRGRKEKIRKERRLLNPLIH